MMPSLLLRVTFLLSSMCHFCGEAFIQSQGYISFHSRYRSKVKRILNLQLVRGHEIPCRAQRNQSLFRWLQIGMNRNHLLDTFLHSYTSLFMEKKNTSAEMRQRGIYSRPSAAIEKGSGFFVPGLEGFRVRLLVASLVLTLNYVNSQYSAPSATATVTATDLYSALTTSQWLTTVYAFILLVQGLVELRKEMLPDLTLGSSLASDESAENSNYIRKEMDQFVSSSLQNCSDDETIDAIRWAAASFISMTPTTHLLLIKQEDHQSEVLYSLGDFNALNGTQVDKDIGMQAAIKAVFEDSVGGRVAIGPSHPASIYLLPQASRRCILLQRLDCSSGDNATMVSNKKKNIRLCLMTGSNNILESYTKNDLKWLGNLAQYIVIHFYK